MPIRPTVKVQGRYSPGSPWLSLRNLWPGLAFCRNAKMLHEWLESRIKKGTVEGLRAAIQVDPANARVTAHLGRRLADQALEQGSDPDEARRARGEADFLTSRALKLAPHNGEVKKLRDEVVKLLGLKTN